MLGEGVRIVISSVEEPARDAASSMARAVRRKARHHALWTYQEQRLARVTEAAHTERRELEQSDTGRERRVERRRAKAGVDQQGRLMRRELYLRQEGTPPAVLQPKPRERNCALRVVDQLDPFAAWLWAERVGEHLTQHQMSERRFSRDAQVESVARAVC